MDAATIAALNRFRGAALREAPSLLIEVHGSEAGAAEGWTTIAEVAHAAGGAALALDDPWAIRELATRAVEAGQPGAITVRTDLAIPIGALPALVAACERVARERDLVVHCFGHAGIGILHALVLADPADRAAADAARGARRAGPGARRLVLGRARDGAREPSLCGTRARGGARRHARCEGALRSARDPQPGQDVVSAATITA
jgi:D-lactate dehydrogenase (cytochrome)